MKPLNIGIIGLGTQGRLGLRTSLLLKEANVLAVADVSERALRFAKEYGVKNIYTNYEDLLKNDNVEAVVINLPNFLHMEGAMKAAESGKHILMEKPLARNVAEGEKILSSVRKNGVKLMIGYDLRFDPVLRKIHDDILDGLYGRVQMAEATNVSGGPFSPRNDSVGPVKVPSWWFDRELAGGGALLDLGSHMIDLLTWYFGDVVQVQAFIEHLLNAGLEDSATCVLKFKDGPVATVKVGWFSKGFLQSLQICGTARNLNQPISASGVWQKIRADVARKVGTNKKNPYFLKLEHFVNCLSNEVQPEPSGEEALRSLQVIELAYKTAFSELQDW